MFFAEKHFEQSNSRADLLVDGLLKVLGVDNGADL